MFSKIQLTIISIICLLGLLIAPAISATSAFQPTDPEATPEATAEPEMDDEDEDEDELPITIVIEGPVQEIHANIITIFYLDIQVAEDDPILTEIVVGDTVRVEGNISAENGTIIIVAVNITIIEIEIIIDAPQQSSRTSEQSKKSSNKKSS